MKYHPLALLFILILSCSSEKDSSTSHQSAILPQVIDVANAEVFDGYFTDLIEDVYFLKLDTQDDALFQSVTNLFITDELVIVFDEQGQSVIIFDDEGAFQTKIYSPGDGPGQYQYLWKVAYDDVKGEVILSAAGKILWFNTQGQFIKEKRVEFSFIKDMASLTGGRLAFHLGMNSSYSFKGQLVVMDSTFTDTKVFFPLPEEAKSRNIINFYSHFSNSKQPLSVNVFSHDISRVDEDTVYTEYRVNFGDDALPEDFIETYVDDPNLNAQAVRDIKEQKGYLAIQGGAVQESGNHLLFLYSKGKEYFYALFDKNNGNTLSIPYQLKVRNRESGYVYFPATYNDYFVAGTGATLLSQVYSNFKNIDEAPILEEVQDEVPFIWFIKFKSDVIKKPIN